MKTHLLNEGHVLFIPFTTPSPLLRSPPFSPSLLPISSFHIPLPVFLLSYLCHPSLPLSFLLSFISLLPCLFLFFTFLCLCSSFHIFVTPPFLCPFSFLSPRFSPSFRPSFLFSHPIPPFHSRSNHISVLLPFAYSLSCSPIIYPPLLLL